MTALRGNIAALRMSIAALRSNITAWHATPARCGAPSPKRKECHKNAAFEGSRTASQPTRAAYEGTNTAFKGTYAAFARAHAAFLGTCTASEAAHAPCCITGPTQFLRVKKRRTPPAERNPRPPLLREDHAKRDCCPSAFPVRSPVPAFAFKPGRRLSPSATESISDAFDVLEHKTRSNGISPLFQPAERAGVLGTSGSLREQQRHRRSKGRSLNLARWPTVLER